MDITTLRVVATVLSFVTFVGIIIWALDKRKNSQFEEAAKLPFLDD
jgi:cytochrome c oxidase cbb3-type subunit 4